MIVKGIVSLLINILSGHTPQEILDADLYFIDKVGLKEHLSPTRSNGLVAMVKQMRLYAMAYRAKEQHKNRCFHTYIARADTYIRVSLHRYRHSLIRIYA